MTTPKLLPCPHCGSEAQLELFDPPPKAIWNVSCKSDCSFDLSGGRAKVIAAWNRRAGQAYADAGLLEVLREIADAAPCHCVLCIWMGQRARAAIAVVKGA